MEEVKVAIKSMKLDSAPRPDGLPVRFCIKLGFVSCSRGSIKGVVMDILQEFDIGVLVASGLNFNPQGGGGYRHLHFRLVTVINVIFRILAKAHAISMTPIVARLSI